LLLLCPISAARQSASGALELVPLVTVQNLARALAAHSMWNFA
jgi:hypothetical protein